jgi:hypothetical protein
MTMRAVKFSKLLGIVAGLALAGGSLAQAQGPRDRVVEREAQREQQQQQQQAQPAAPAPDAQPQVQQQRRSAPVQQSQQAQQPGPRGRVVEREAQRAAEQRRGNYGYPGRPNGGYYGNGRPPVVVGSPGYYQGGARFRNPNYGRVVTRLPPGYRDYRWRGNPYYYSGGSWYSRRGSSYIVVGAPFGLYVDYLPSYYSTVWVGGSRYYYADDTYYTYDTSRRGYIVSRSPYNDDDARYDDENSGASSANAEDELYIYPVKGQSEQQQADDKYECHKWSFDQTGYDPTQMEHDSGKREQYDRALTACLTARGYSVK